MDVFVYENEKSGDLVGAEGLDGMRDESGDDTQEVLHVGECGVGVEGGLIEPFGMNGKRERFADGLEKVDPEAAGFGASGGDNAEQFVAKLVLFAGDGFEADEDVERHRWRGIVA